MEGVSLSQGCPLHQNHVFTVPPPSAPGPPRTWRMTGQAPWPLWRPSAGPQALSPLYVMRAEGVQAVFNPRGLMGHVETHLSMSRMYLSSHYSSAILFHPAFSWIHYETDLPVLSPWVFIHPAPGFSHWDCGRGYGGPLRPFGYTYAPPPIGISYFHIETCSLSLQREEHRHVQCGHKPHNLEF